MEGKFRSLHPVAKIAILLTVGILSWALVGVALGEGTVDVIVNGTSNMTIDDGNSSVVITSIENETLSVNITSVNGTVLNRTAINQTALNVTVPIENNLTAVPENWTSPRIDQGQCVEIGKTYDIAGMGWYTGYIGWFGTYEDAFAPTNDTLKYRIEIPNTRSKLSNFYIDPKVFFQRQGYWYVMYKKEESSANNRLFYVSSKCERVYSNEAVTNTTSNITQVTRLPMKEGGGYVVAKGDDLQYPFFGMNESRVWIFNEDGIYDRYYNVSKNATANETLLTRPEDFESGPSDIYTVAIITKGENNIWEARYNESTRSIVSPFVDGRKIDTTGFTPGLVLKALTEYMNGTIDDKIQTVKVDVQDPQIYIAQMDETRVSDNVSIMDIRGYTNFKAGTKILIDVDTYQSNTYIPSTETAYSLAEGDPLEWRQFHILLPILYKGQAVGEHFLVARDENRLVEVTAPFYIRKETTENYKRPEYVMWVDNSPYLKPIVIINETKVEVPVIKKEIVKVIEPLDYTKLADEELRRIMPTVYASIVGVVIGLYLLWVIARTYVRRKCEKHYPQYEVEEPRLW